MCKFLSWIELPNGELKYISDFELNTRDGQKLRKSLFPLFGSEIVGHGAIKTYFGLTNHAGKDCECANFSDPNNFPDKIVGKIKEGKFSKLGLNGLLLTALAWEKYKKVTGPDREEYKKVTALAREEYEKVTALAWEEYKKVTALAWEECEKATGPAWEKYKKVTALAWEEYKKVTGPAREEYKKVTDLAREKYKKNKLEIFWELFANPQNRPECWK